MEDTIVDENSIDKARRSLEITSQVQKIAMETELAHLASRVKKMGTGALLVGGTALLVFLIGRQLFSSGKKDKKKVLLEKQPTTQLMIAEPKEESPIVRMIKEQMALFLIAIVKEKLTAFIKASENK